MKDEIKNGWTPARRRRQAEAIGRWKPWENSTGPRSESGKNAVRDNALRHGMRSAAGEELRGLLYAQRLLVNALLRDE